ncbi:sulfatase-like hydrolase/transferase [Candidatus Electronema sp. PJ]|uniref:phosphoethanolamine transferase n=1 Tax=Candidatus Electronema sp. PJ TaxID=3401572 RepID=UPI003AA7B35C
MKSPSKSIHYFLVAILLLLLPVVVDAFFSIDSIASTPTRKIAYILYGFSFVLFLLPFLRPRKLLLVLSPVIFIAPVEIYIAVTLKSSLNKGIMASIFNTHSSEALEILMANGLYILVSILYLSLYIFLALCVSRSFSIGKKTRVLFVALVLLCQGGIVARDIYVALMLIKNNNLTDHSFFDHIVDSYILKAQKTFPANWVLSFIGCQKDRRNMMEYNEKIKSFTFGAREVEPADARKVIVLVIGETARRNNFSLYGYERKTNPLLEKETNLIAMKDAETVYNLTMFSVVVFLSRATDKNFKLHLSEPSLLKAFREAGFYTVYINNQPFWNSMLEIYAKQADQLEDITSKSSMYSDSYATDESIIPVFDRILKNNNHKNLLIVIHSLGSHFRYSLRYSGDYEVFKPVMKNKLDFSSISRKYRDELINSYDNSIMFTDFFLYQLISMMKSRPEYASLMLYASDHGENIYDDDKFGFTHGGTVMSEYEKEIPFLIWRSETYDKYYANKIQTLKEHADVAVNTTHIFHSLLDLSGIYINDETHRKSFANKKFENASSK